MSWKSEVDVGGMTMVGHDLDVETAALTAKIVGGVSTGTAVTNTRHLAGNIRLEAFQTLASKHLAPRALK